MSGIEHVAVYARISEDDSGEGAGVKDQLKGAREFAEVNGWTVVAERIDNDISALRGKPRPGYSALMADADAGRISRIVVFHSSRLWRNRRERAEGIERLARAKVSVSSVKGPALDLSTAYGRGMAGMLGEFDTMESEVKSERVEAAARRRADSGDPNGAVPFGWTRVIETNERGVRNGARDVFHPEEAPIVAEVCRRLLAGESLLGVTAWLNESGVPAPGAKFKLKGRDRGLANPDGRRWGKTSVRKIALRAQNCGMRQYRQGTPDERLLPMKADPIITREQWERLVARLTDPRRKTNKPGARRHLLSHCRVGQCGVCGGLLRSQTKRGRYGQPQTLYACADKGCVGRKQEYVDALVQGAVVGRLTMMDARDLLMGDDTRARAALDKAEGLRARLATAADQFADDLITADQIARITARLRPQIESAEREAAEASPDVPLELLAELAGELAPERWEALSVSQQSRVLDVLVESVRILPSTRRGPGFDPASVKLRWRGQPEAD